MDIRPRIWMFGISRLRDTFRDVAAQYDTLANLTIIARGFEDAVRDIEDAGADAPDVVISAGSNGNYLKARIPIPVVLVTPTGFDVMHALARARHEGTAIGLVMHGELPSEMTGFLDEFGTHIVCRSYVSVEDAELRILELRECGIDVVVGPGLVTELAEKAGLKAVFLYSRTSVELALNTALAFVQTPRVQRIDRSIRSMHSGKRKTHLRAKYHVEDLIGTSPPMQRVRDQVRSYARSDATVLIRGESGTGKELAAQSLHNGSRRRAYPFVVVNCGAFPESLLESELFGYEEGAFTGARRGGKAGLIETAHGGTLFLDEIGEMPLSLQSRLLRVLQEREVVRLGSTEPIPVDVRIVAATHKPLAEFAASGAFRIDLFYRLNILNLTLPPLRERVADLEALSAHLLFSTRTIASVDAARIALAAVQPVFAAYHWPGNVRELQNVMARVAVTLEDSSMASQEVCITAAHLRDLAPEITLSPTLHISRTSTSTSSATTLRQLSQQSAADVAREALEAANGDRDLAAKALGISKTTLWRKLNSR